MLSIYLQDITTFSPHYNPTQQLLLFCLLTEEEAAAQSVLAPAHKKIGEPGSELTSVLSRLHFLPIILTPEGLEAWTLPSPPYACLDPTHPPGPCSE